MRFRYMPMADGAERPALRARIVGPKGSVQTIMLVDSGADDTLVPLSLLERIGAALGPELQMNGVGGSLITGCVSEAKFEFAGLTYRGHLVGCPALEGQLSVLGHRDFFNRFWVAFDAANKEFWVNPTRQR